MAGFLFPGCGGGGGSSSDGGRPSGSNIQNLGQLQIADANGVMLPPGFTSRIVARSGVPPVAGSIPWHAAPDGGACYTAANGGWIYVSNSEVGSGGGSVSALRFDSSARIVSAISICTNTSNNCAGGRTPWGTWLTCEENGDGGRVFECDPTGAAPAIERPALGRFQHEAVAFNDVDGRFYLTEDRSDGRLYRFTPSGPGSVAAGTLEVAQVLGGLHQGPVTWLALSDPSGSPTPTRNQAPASTPFDRGEGIACFGSKVHFATTGNNRVWSYDVATQILSIVYDHSTSSMPILTGVDNVEVSVGGEVLVAEDGGDMQLVALTPSGAVKVVLQLVGQDNSEITGPAFDPSGSRLYFSSQRGTTGRSEDGITYEVTGPFAA